jgi:hypothetical protein
VGGRVQGLGHRRFARLRVRSYLGRGEVANGRELAT